jgi:hypothetical protein
MSGVVAAQRVGRRHPSQAGAAAQECVPRRAAPAPGLLCSYLAKLTFLSSVLQYISGSMGQFLVTPCISCISCISKDEDCMIAELGLSVWCMRCGGGRPRMSWRSAGRRRCPRRQRSSPARPSRRKATSCSVRPRSPNRYPNQPKTRCTISACVECAMCYRVFGGLVQRRRKIVEARREAAAGDERLVTARAVRQ